MQHLTKRLPFSLLRAAAAIAVTVFAWSSFAAEPLRTMPKAEECIDVARLNSVSEAERAVLRIEWRAGLARAEESRLLNEMYERIERMQRTTYDIRVLMNAIPSPSERVAALNSPSGLGPSAMIPPVSSPVVAPPTAPAVAPTLPSPTTTTSPAEATPPSVAAASLISPVAPVATPAASQATDQPTPPRTPKPPPTFVNAAPEDSPFALKVVSNFQLVGGGLVFVALVVLWWLRRRSEDPSPSESSPVVSAPKRATGVAQEANITPPGVRTLAFSAQSTEQIGSLVSPPEPATELPAASANNTAEHLPKTPSPPAVSEAVSLPPQDEQGDLNVMANEDATTVMTGSTEVDFPLDVVTDAANDLAAEPLVVATPVPPSPPQVTSPAASVPVPAQSEESILELAEMMLAMGLATGAAQKLVDHIRDNPKKALAHWLKLLEIYRESGQRSKFEQAAKQLQKEFNIRASDWMRGSVERPRLEKFDRVYTKTEELWTQPALCVAFLSGILADNRDGTRVGFPQEVAEEILLLIDILKDVSGISES